MQLQGYEADLVQALTSLLYLVVSLVIAYFVPHAKNAVNAHLTAKNAEIANKVIDGLSQIAFAVVNTFNQNVVADAKKYGLFTPELAASVKQDAIEAVKAQGANLIELGKDVLGDVDALISSLIEHAVVKSKTAA